MSKLASAVRPEAIPADFPVRPLGPNDEAICRATCGVCGLSWDDGKATGWTPAPAARCPFEYFHKEESADESEAFLLDIATRLRRHLDSNREAAFAALGELMRHAKTMARIMDNRHGNGPQASAYAGIALALDVLRELVPAW